MDRRLAAALALCLLATGPAAASGVTVEVDPLPKPLCPLASGGVTSLTATVDCTLVLPTAAGGTKLVLEVAGAPSWAVIRTEPAFFEVDTLDCRGLEAVAVEARHSERDR